MGGIFSNGELIKMPEKYDEFKIFLNKHKLNLLYVAVLAKDWAELKFQSLVTYACLRDQLL